MCNCLKQSNPSNTPLCFKNLNFNSNHTENININFFPQVRIDIVLDNAGVEFFTDLVLAEFLLSARIADEVVFQPKAIPWYVSDVIPGDLTKLYDLLSAWENDDVTVCVNRFKNRFGNIFTSFDLLEY